MNTLEIDVRDGLHQILVNERPLVVGDHLQADQGFNPEQRVDQRFLAILAYLAIRKIGGLTDGWVSAQDLAFVVDKLEKTKAIQKWLERRLDLYGGRSPFGHSEVGMEVEDIPSGILIQHKPHGGYSKGPYRLGASIGSRFSLRAAWEIATGVQLETILPLLQEDKYLEFAEDILNQSELFLLSGSLLEARYLVAGVLETLLEKPSRYQNSNSKDRKRLLLLQAKLFSMLANFDMELGQTNQSIAAAKRAALLYHYLKKPDGEAHAYQVLAHAYGQFEDVFQAYQYAEKAWRLCDQSRAIRSGLGRALYIGVLGQRAIKLKDHRGADKRLEKAFRTYEENGVGQWAAIWSLRRAENAIAAERLSDAEKYLIQTHDLAKDPRVTVPHWAAITRITSLFHTDAGEHDEAVRWAVEAYNIGVERQMANQLRLMQPILHRLEISSDEL